MVGKRNIRSRGGPVTSPARAALAPTPARAAVQTATASNDFFSLLTSNLETPRRRKHQRGRFVTDPIPVQGGLSNLRHRHPVSPAVGEGVRRELGVQKTAGRAAARAQKNRKRLITMAKREHKVLVSLNDQEATRLDEIRGDEERAVYLRRLLHEAPKGDEIATHGEAMAILTRLARDGKVVGRRRAGEDAPGRPSRLGSGGLPPWQLGPRPLLGWLLPPLGSDRRHPRRVGLPPVAPALERGPLPRRSGHATSQTRKRAYFPPSSSTLTPPRGQHHGGENTTGEGLDRFCDFRRGASSPTRAAARW